MKWDSFLFPFKYLDTIRALGEKKKMATVTVDRSYRHSFYSFFLDSTFYRQDTHRTDCVTICVGSTPFLFSSTLTPHLFFVCEADELFLFPSTIQLILLGGIASLPTTVFVRPPFYIPLLHPLLPSYLFFFFGYFSPPPPPLSDCSHRFSLSSTTPTHAHTRRGKPSRKGKALTVVLLTPALSPGLAQYTPLSAGSIPPTCNTTCISVSLLFLTPLFFFFLIISNYLFPCSLLPLSFFVFIVYVMKQTIVTKSKQSTYGGTVIGK